VLFCASLAAQSALFPLLALHFHRLAPAGLLLNLLAVPLASGVLLAGFGVLASSALLPTLAPLAGRLAWLVAHLLLRSSELGLVAPALDPRVPAPSALAWAAWLAGIVFVARGQRGRGLGFVAASVRLVAMAPAQRPIDGRLHLTVLDVGQGDALVVRSPAGRLFVVDAGGARAGAFDMGEAVVGPYLWWLGARRVEDVVVSHAHPDHAGGVPFLLRAFGVRGAWEGPAPTRDRDYARLDEALGEAGVRRRSMAAGMRAEWDGVAVSVLGPRPPPSPPRIVRNEDSLVLALDYGEVRLLLTGDVQGEDGSSGARAGRRREGSAPRQPLEQPSCVRGRGSSPARHRVGGPPQRLRPPSSRGDAALSRGGRAPARHGARRGRDRVDGRPPGLRLHLPYRPGGPGALKRVMLTFEGYGRSEWDRDTS
jgi:competence protein ComEC